MEDITFYVLVDKNMKLYYIPVWKSNNTNLPGNSSEQYSFFNSHSL
jgi:hypothetical protein